MFSLSFTTAFLGGDISSSADETADMAGLMGDVGVLVMTPRWADRSLEFVSLTTPPVWNLLSSSLTLVFRTPEVEKFRPSDEGLTGDRGLPDEGGDEARRSGS